jgi:hypothetical protein
MRDHETLVERRQHKRFKVQEGMFAVLGGDYVKLGPIVDVGRGGLSFHYVKGDEQTDASREMTIFSSRQDFYLTGVPFRTVLDLKLPSEVPLSSITMSRCGVQFGDLTDYQSSQLEHFIGNHTAGVLGVVR